MTTELAVRKPAILLGARPLTKVLTYHVVSGKLESKEIAAMQLTDLVLKVKKGYRRLAFVF